MGILRENWNKHGKSLKKHHVVDLLEGILKYTGASGKNSVKIDLNRC